MLGYAAETGSNSQFEQRPVGVAVAELLLTLLLEVSLEDLGGLRIVPLKPGNYAADLFWPLLGVFAVHGGRSCAGNVGLLEEKSNLGGLARTLQMVGRAFPLLYVFFVCGWKRLAEMWGWASPFRLILLVMCFRGWLAELKRATFPGDNVIERVRVGESLDQKIGSSANNPPHDAGGKFGPCAGRAMNLRVACRFSIFGAKPEE